MDMFGMGIDAIRSRAPHSAGDLVAGRESGLSGGRLWHLHGEGLTDCVLEQVGKCLDISGVGDLDLQVCESLLRFGWPAAFYLSLNVRPVFYDLHAYSFRLRGFKFQRRVFEPAIRRLPGRWAVRCAPGSKYRPVMD